MTVIYRHETGIRLLQTLSELRAVMSEATDDAKWRHEMFLNHWSEVAGEKDLMKLDPDYDRYRQLIEAGKLIVVTARDDDKMVGYVFYIIGNHLHYKTAIMSLDDLHYMRPEYRGHGRGKAMLEKGDEVLKSLGVSYATLRAKKWSNHSEIFASMGYNEIETIWGKRLT